MNILIVGGGGFIGSALVRHFSAEHRCICFGHGRNFGELRARIPGDVEYVEGDITDQQLIARVVSRADAVIFAAGTGGEADCLANPTQSLLTHVHGAHLLLHEVRRRNIERYIFTSTIAVYGTHEARPMPLSEEMAPRPDEFYGALKSSAERELIDSDRFRILRLANVYGSRLGPTPASSGVAEKFVDLIQQGRPLRVFGDGAQRIDYVHVEDVCRSFELALRQPAAESFIYNVGGGNPVSIRTLAETCVQVAESTGHEVQIQYEPAPAGKLWPDRWLAIDKIKRELEWEPRVSLAEGLEKMFVRSLAAGL